MRKVPRSDVAYTGLSDTAQGYTGASTLDVSVDPGSSLPLYSENTYQGAMLTTSTYDLWDQPSPSASLALSGVSDPPFASAGLSTPYPKKMVPSETLTNAFTGLSKFGSGIATMLGSHPVTKQSAPSRVHGPKAGALTSSTVPSGFQTVAVVIVVVALGLLLLRGGE